MSRKAKPGDVELPVDSTKPLETSGETDQSAKLLTSTATPEPAPQPVPKRAPSWGEVMVRQTGRAV